jgi:hypothetical protein
MEGIQTGDDWNKEEGLSREPNSVKNKEPVEKFIFFRLIYNAPASAPQGGAMRRKADAS